MQIVRNAIVLLLALTVAGASASGGFYSGKSDGWFWYEDPEIIEEEEAEEEPPAPPAPPMPEEKPEPEPAPPSVSVSTSAGPAPLSTAWFRQNLQIYMDKAIDEPTPENVEAYFLLQRVMMDKANNFARASQETVIGNPYIDETMNRPMSQAGFQQIQRDAKVARERLAESISEKAGLVFFIDQDCQLCGQVADLLNHVSQLYGFTVLAVSLDGTPVPKRWFDSYIVDNGQAATLDVEFGPAVFLASPPGMWSPIARGVVTEPEFLNRIAIAAKKEGLITEEQYLETTTYQDSPNLAGVLDELDELPEDTGELINLLKGMEER